MSKSSKPPAITTKHIDGHTQHRARIGKLISMPVRIMLSNGTDLTLFADWVVRSPHGDIIMRSSARVVYEGTASSLLTKLLNASVMHQIHPIQSFDKIELQYRLSGVSFIPLEDWFGWLQGYHAGPSRPYHHVFEQALDVREIADDLADQAQTMLGLALNQFQPQRGDA